MRSILSFLLILFALAFLVPQQAEARGFRSGYRFDHDARFVSDFSFGHGQGYGYYQAPVGFFVAPAPLIVQPIPAQFVAPADPQPVPLQLPLQAPEPINAPIPQGYVLQQVAGYSAPVGFVVVRHVQTGRLYLHRHHR